MTLFIMPNMLKEPKSLSMDEWINKFIFNTIYKLEYYLVTWMKLEDIVNEVIHKGDTAGHH